MANSQEYSTMLLEANYDAYVSTMKASIDKFGGDYSDPDFHNWKFDSDTDWYKELLRSALITNHSLGISGGTEKSTYSVGMSYLYQDGVMDVENNYKRLNFRAALDYEAANWLKVGFNGVFSNSTQVLPQIKLGSRHLMLRAFIRFMIRQMIILSPTSMHHLMQLVSLLTSTILWQQPTIMIHKMRTIRY